jgi:uncharacterized membrane protein
MSDKDKYSFIVVKYPQKETADVALKAVLGLQKEKVVKLRDAVTITKTEKGKLKLHQTKDDTAKKGFLKGGAIGVLFALLFGPVGWVAAGAALGTAFAMFDRGIKDKLLKELGENMTPEQSAMAVLVEEADWETALGRMADLKLQGEVVVQEMVAEHLAAIEKLVDVPPTTEAVPEELKVEAPAAEAPAAEAPAAEAAPAEAAPAKAAGVVFWDDATAQGEAKP